MSRRPTVSLARRPLAVLATLSFASLFIAAPTPGNVGGCGGNAGSTRIDRNRPPPGVPADQNSPVPPTDEYAFFDRGLCASFCLRLRECGVLCAAMGMQNGVNCDNNSPDAYVMCMRGRYEPQGCNPASDAGACTVVGALNPAIFDGEDQCSRSCAGPVRRPPSSLTFQAAFEWDVQACSDAVSQVACASLPQVLTAPPRECINVCR